MNVYARAFIGSALTFLVLDAVWLGLVAGGFYRSQLGELIRPAPNWPAAGAFYLLYLAGLLALAVMPALTEGSWSAAATNGAVLGLVAYGTYSLTKPLGMRQAWFLVSSSPCSSTNTHDKYDYQMYRWCDAISRERTSLTEETDSQ